MLLWYLEQPQRAGLGAVQVVGSQLGDHHAQIDRWDCLERPGLLRASHLACAFAERLLGSTKQSKGVDPEACDLEMGHRRPIALQRQSEIGMRHRSLWRPG